MAFDTSDLAAIDALVAEQQDVLAVIRALRRRFPNVPVTQCDPSDIDLEVSFRKWPRLSLHLVDSSNHCWSLTSDAERATGLLLVVTP